MSEVTIVSGAPGTNATGMCTQTHLIYATNSARWWLFFFSGTQTLATMWSSDFVTWTAGATLTLAHPHNSEGRNLGVAYANLSSNDVVHIGVSYQNSTTSHQHFHVRATISGSTISYSSELQVSGTGIDNFSHANDGTTTVIGSGGQVTDGASFFLDTVSWDDFEAYVFANSDNGTSWTQSSTTAQARVASAGNGISSHFLAMLSSTSMLFLTDKNGNSNSTDLQWSKWTGTWSATASVIGSAQTGFAANDWGAVARSTSDVHCLIRLSTNTYKHMRYNGTAWSAGDSVATQNSLASGGIAMATNGTNVWAFVIDTDTPNTVRVSKWISGTGWSAWTAFESSTQTRKNIGCCPQLENTLISVYWTEGTSTFNIVGEQFAPNTRTVTTSVALKATQTRTVSPATTALQATKTRTVTTTTALLVTQTRTIPETTALIATASRTVTSTCALRASQSRTVTTQAALLWTQSRTVGETGALLATSTRTVSASATLQALRTVPDSAALLQTSTRTVGGTTALLATDTRAVSATGALWATSTRSISATGAIFEPSSRTISTAVSLMVTKTRTVGSDAALLATLIRTVTAEAALEIPGITERVVPTHGALIAPNILRTVTLTVALFETSVRVVSAQAAFIQTADCTVGTSVALQALNVSRDVPTSATIQATGIRSVGMLAALQSHNTRTLSAGVALQTLNVTRSLPASAALQVTRTRAVPVTSPLWQQGTRTVPTGAALQAIRLVACTTALWMVGTRTVLVGAALSIIPTEPNATILVRNGQASITVRSGSANVGMHSGNASITVP